MQAIIYSFVWLVDRIRSLFGMVFPIFAEAADFRTWPKWLRIVVHVIVIGVIVFLLYLLNKYEFVTKWLNQKSDQGFIPYFLPTMFILIYMLSWVLYYWWQLYNRSDAPEYPDILDAWTVAMERLRKEKIDIIDLPLYIVLGEPHTGDDALILYSSGFAAEKKLYFREPQEGKTVIRVYGGQAGLFVTCGMASGWGTLCRKVTEPDTVAVASAADSGGAGMGGQTLDFNQVLNPDDKREFFALKAKGANRTSEETTRFEELGRKINEQGRSDAPAAVGLSQEEKTEGPKRLAYLCRLIAESRRPVCPINGVLVVVPWGAVTTDDACSLSVQTLKNDLDTIRTNIGQLYPHVVMVSDLEDIRGFETLRAGFRNEVLKSRVGTKMPVVPDQQGNELQPMLRRVVEHIRQNSITGWLLEFLRTTWPSEKRDSYQFVPPNNQQLFMFQYSFFQNLHRLERILHRGFPSNPDSSDPVEASPLLAGCYVGSARKPSRTSEELSANDIPQAFVPGVFGKLRETQSQVRWTEAAIRADVSLRRKAMLCYVISVMLLVLNVAMCYWIYRNA